MKIKKRILVIGDDLTFFQSAKDFMANSSTEVSYAMSVKEALNYLLSSEYCIVVICISLSVDSSIEFLRLVRETYLMPILVITPKLRVSEKVALFHAGANACLERPVDAALCVAQARSLVQLYSDAKLTDKKVHPLVFGTELIINPVYRHVIIDGEPLELTRTEFDLLYYMAEHPNQIFSRQQLYQQVWGDDLGISGENTVRSHIGNIYKKLADVDKHYIQTPEGSAINLFLLLVKNKNGSAGAFCFGTSILSNYDESLAAILL